MRFISVGLAALAAILSAQTAARADFRGGRPVVMTHVNVQSIPRPAVNIARPSPMISRHHMGPRPGHHAGFQGAGVRKIAIANTGQVKATTNSTSPPPPQTTSVSQAKPIESLDTVVAGSRIKF